MTSSTCQACQRIYSSKGNLDKHIRTSKVCESWLKEIGSKASDWKDSPNLYNLIQYSDIRSDDLVKSLIPSISGTDCFYCFKKFASTSALHKHMRSSVVCDRWRQHDVLSNAQRLLSDQTFKESLLTFKPSQWSADDGTYVKFDAPKYSISHIIWNVFLVDKEFIKKVDFEEVCAENKVKYIIGIVPDQKTFEEAISFDIEHSLMLYEGHTTSLDLQRFDEECNKIELHRNKRDNVIVFCNKGYQRSLPFICYYLFKRHHDEIPTLDKAVDMILPQVDKSNYAEIRDKTIESISGLFEENDVL